MTEIEKCEQRIKVIEDVYLNNKLDDLSFSFDDDIINEQLVSILIEYDRPLAYHLMSKLREYYLMKIHNYTDD